MSSLSPRTVCLQSAFLLLSSRACCSKFTRGELIQILGVVVVDAATFFPRVFITIGKESAAADHFDYFIITRDLLLCSWTVSVCVFLLWKSGRVEEQPKQQPKRCRRQTQEFATGFIPHVNHSGRLSRQQQQRNTSQTRSLLSPAHPST